jgi:hypothetical protein
MKQAIEDGFYIACVITFLILVPLLFFRIGVYLSRPSCDSSCVYEQKN